MAPKTVSISVKYTKLGTQPPIFLAGSFTDPAWQPQEMQYTTDANNEHDFFKEVTVEQGKEYQYKFRIGLGDWWVLNEDSPTGSDDAGNRNNVLTAPVTDDTIDSKSTEDSSVMEEPKKHASLGVKEISAEPIEKATSEREITPEPEEAMGTRESSDILFSDEIIMDSEEPKGNSLPLTPDLLEPHPTPAYGLEENKGDLFKNLKATKDCETKDRFQKEDSSKIPAIEEPKGNSLPLTPEPLEPHLAPAFGMMKSKDDLFKDLKDTKEDDAKLKSFDDVNKSKEDNTKVPHSTKSIEPALSSPESGLEDGLPTPPSETEKSQVEHIEDKEETTEPLQAPIVVVEKVDDEPSHGDDFGPDATTGQKDAHNLRAQDAEPDHTIIRQQSRTPELADVAAEVADTAEALDQDAPTPPISDEEAGRIGYRRMSNTPIPEVANTAAEVADVAATLDNQHIGDLLEARGYFAIINDESIVFPETPPDEKVPLFPHEGGVAPPTPKPSSRNKHLNGQRRPSKLQEPVFYDPNNPSILPFPEDREGILRQLELMQQRLPPDTADCVGVDAPISEEIHCPGIPISPAVYPQIQDESPSLDSITEEKDDDQQLLLHAGNVNGDGLTCLSTVEEAEEEKQPEVKVNGVKEAVQPQVKANGAQDAVEEPVQAEKETISTPAITVHGENAKPEPMTEPEVKGRSVEAKSAASPLIEPVLAHSIEGSMDGTEAAKEYTIENFKSAAEPDLGHTKGSDDSEKPLSVSPTRIPATPFVAGNRQLGHGDEVQNITTPSGPSIQVQPATPRESTAGQNLLDTGNSSAIDNGSTQIKSRKQTAKSLPDRPLTPSSIRGREHSKNFLKAVWRVIFVEWIGGVIMRLCNGGRGRQT